MKNTWQNLPDEEIEKVFETSIEFGLTEDKVTERSGKRKRRRNWWFYRGTIDPAL